jgi:hypothetical protein
LATTTEDVIHIHGGHDGGGKVTDQLSPLRLPGVVREPGLHLVKVLASAELHGGEDDVCSLLDSCHHSLLMVLHLENLLEAGFLHLMARGHQLLLRWQQEDKKVRSCG